ncbi:Hypothetical protein A7982_08224 [Minicystis rosea]|nr:Hypothetical protein A7982_08224 [Minicystis rosea]
MRTDASGAGWIGGDQDGRAMLVRLTGLGSASPTVAGTHDLGAGTGSRINSIALAPGGDAIVSLYTGGADRAFVVARIKPTGAVAWSKAWESGGSGANDNTHVVRLDGNTVYAGGNVAVETADTTHGDGFVLGLDAATGAYKLGALYYSGKNTEYIAKHLVKGFVFGSDVFALTQGTTVQGNVDHYWGYWYQAPDDTPVLPAGDGAKRLVDYALAPQPLANVSLLSVAPGVVGPNGTNGGTAHLIDTSTIWKDLPKAAVWTKAKGYSGETSQTHPLFSRLTLDP